MNDHTVSSTLPAVGRCSECNSPLGVGQLADLCPRCLLAGVIRGEAAPASLPAGFEGYEVHGLLGHGGMGTVFLARDLKLDRFVAIKCLRDGVLADATARRQILREGQILAGLKDAHIVRVFSMGERGGEPYFVMDYLPNGTLRDRLRDQKERGTPFTDPSRAARLVATVARAVHAGHRGRVLHRDLKPENILFDERDEPHVSDFGIARHLGGTSSTALKIAGTIPYMSPEQTLGQDDHETVDVWALGVILYEMVAGRVPFDGPTEVEVQRAAANDAPEPLAHLTSPRDHDIATVCLACLEKEPGHRYRSALALAEDLERCLRDVPPIVKRPSAAQRAWRWSRRNPLIAALLSASVTTLIALSLWGVGTGFAQAAARREEVLNNNVFSARAVAAMVLVQLQEFANVVAEEARNEQLGAAVEAGDDGAVQALVTSIHARRAGSTPGLSYWFVANAEGHLAAHYPDPKVSGSWSRDFSFRDYFRGASEQRPGAHREVYVSRAFIAGTDGQYKVAIVSPIRDKGGAMLGLLAAEIVTDPRLGALVLSDDRRLTALAIRRDRESSSEPMPDEHILLVHDGVEHGEGVRIENAALRRLAARRSQRGISSAGDDQLRLPPPELVESDGDYHDPLSPRDPRGAEGPFLAGIAPVGGTELAVVVQTRSGAALDIDQLTVRVLIAWSVVGAALLFAGVFAILRTTWRQRRPGSTR